MKITLGVEIIIIFIYTGIKLSKDRDFQTVDSVNRTRIHDRRGEAAFKTASNQLVVEDLKLGTNKDIEPKDIFEMDCNRNPVNSRPYQ